MLVLREILIFQQNFIKVKSLEGEIDEKNLYPHTFEIYERKEGSYDHLA